MEWVTNGPAIILVAGLFDTHPMTASLFEAHSILKIVTYKPSGVVHIWKIGSTTKLL